ncbi:DNA polymerase IV [Carnimonas sp. LMG 33810]
MRKRQPSLLDIHPYKRDHSAMKKILHADCDCFYAAVEMRDRPELRDIPIAVGGRPEGRGVIATCNYPARTFGIHSAMSSAQALRLCPQLTLIKPDFDRYREVSAQIMAIFKELTEQVEPLSLDEAYLDISDVERFKGSGTWMAQWLKKEVLRRTGITVSTGVAPNKFLAKIASDWRKPDGLFVITPEQVDDFVAELGVDKLPGVGPATAQRLKQLDITTCTELSRCALPMLLDRFGKFGQRLYELSRGIDHREIKVHRERKSISAENTFDRDLTPAQVIEQELSTMVDKLTARIDRHGNPASSKIFVKLRFNDFTTTTLESSAMLPSIANFAELFERAWQRGQRPVRLVGVGIRLRDAEDSRQLGLFSTAPDEASSVPEDQ